MSQVCAFLRHSVYNITINDLSFTPCRPIYVAVDGILFSVRIFLFLSISSYLTATVASSVSAIWHETRELLQVFGHRRPHKAFRRRTVPVTPAVRAVAVAAAVAGRDFEAYVWFMLQSTSALSESTQSHWQKLHFALSAAAIACSHKQRNSAPRKNNPETRRLQCAVHIRIILLHDEFDAILRDMAKLKRCIAAGTLHSRSVNTHLLFTNYW